MPMDVYVGTETLVEKQCGNCGIWFAVPDWFERECKELGPRKSWTCPNGHGRHYSEGKAEKREIERLRAENVHLRDQKEAVERSLSAQKGQVTKLKKRIGNGVCPCCNRHFKNVERHMASQHPDYTEAVSS